MAINPRLTESTFDNAFKTLGELRCFNGPPAQFWPAFVGAAGGLIGASRGVLIVRDAEQRLKKLTDWSAHGHVDRASTSFTRALEQLAKDCFERGQVTHLVEQGLASDRKHFAVAVTVPVPGSKDLCVAAFLLPENTEEQAREAIARLQLTADTPTVYRLNQSVQQARTDVEKFASVLDVMVLVNAETRFMAASMAFCNGLASRYQCDRVSLGWLESGYIRLRTISRTERFDRNMAAVKALELCMEEALDQDEELVWPAPEGSALIAKDHEAFSRTQNSAHLCSLPLRLDTKAVAVLTCERQSRPFTPVELQEFRLACDQAARRLCDLKRQDRWFGARMAMTTREKLAKALGPEHTWAKVLAVLAVAALIFLVLPIFTYRVEGTFILRSDEVSFMSAPFEGHIGQVNVRPGDRVAKGTTLLTFDTRDLNLEEAAALADYHRYIREAEKSRAEAETSRNSNAAALADMRIAQALADQAKAKLDIIRYRLDQATVKAPFDAFLVEGDLRQRIGAPVKTGDLLFKVARIDKLYVEADVNERDIHEILNRSRGEVAFVSQPKLKFPVKVIQIEPAAFAKEGKNLFVVRMAADRPPEDWWRPGMSGIAKLNVEKRTLLWILTHRTVDFLRMLLWW